MIVFIVALVVVLVGVICHRGAECLSRFLVLFFSLPGAHFQLFLAVMCAVHVVPVTQKRLVKREFPRKGETFSSIMADVEQHIMPGTTHWQHPRCACCLQYVPYRIYSGK